MVGISAKRTALICALGLIVASCRQSQPINNVSNHVVPGFAQQRLSEEKVGELIARAAVTTNWSVESAGTGRYRVTTRWREFSAIAEVAYTRQSYSIQLDSSQNLKEKNGMIHPRYNEKVRALTFEIDRQLNLAAFN
ncbi:MAG: hypothetical protein HY059_02175 [Proteobacteria bacterium]|nr:hypothetical protein [Pseudomonadota bacterium]